MPRSVLRTSFQQHCDHCGRVCGDFAGGHSSAYVNGIAHKLCHPNAAGRPDCYTLVTRERHDVPCGDCHIEQTK